MRERVKFLLLNLKNFVLDILLVVWNEEVENCFFFCFKLIFRMFLDCFDI